MQHRGAAKVDHGHEAADHTELEQLGYEVTVTGVQSGGWEGHARFAPFREVPVHGS